MEAALVSVATGVLKPVIGKLTTLLGNEYKRFKTVRKEIKSLTHELAAMEAFLLKMSEVEDPDPQDTVWMNEVRELSYDMEDAIDDFMQSVGDKDEKPDGFIEKIKSSLGKLGKMKARRRIGREIQDLKKQIIEVGNRNARYKSRETFSKTINATVDPRALVIFEHASKLVGIDIPKADIVKLLTEGAVTDEQPKLVSIVGTGGMGKTTLANQVYQDLKGKFECQAFVSVSRKPDMVNILRIIFNEVSGESYTSTEVGSIQQLIMKITNFLSDRNKRYFVVVDDIWDVQTWDVIKCAFPMTSSGSIIITTTRINDVAKSCHSSFSGDIYNIRPLNPVHSKELFQGRLFDSQEDLPSHLEKVSDEILKKCDGLPLAIIAISGLLANREKTEDVWNQVKESIGCALERNSSVEAMMKILSLSYFDLPPHLKSCLLYMSIFSEDTLIEKKGLIWRWIGEGLIHKEGSRYTAHEMGERCFNELINRGLIQPARTNDYGEVESCRVHDTILDLIISKSTYENFVTIFSVPILTCGTQNKVVRRLSLQEGNLTIQPACLVLSHIRSLVVFPSFGKIPYLEEFRHLRVLSLKHYHQLEDYHLENIVRLFQLRYLNLYKTGIRELPEQIGSLGCLEMLDLRFNHLKELPGTIVNLGKLLHLLVDGGVKLPDGIAKMQALETLEDVKVCIQPFDFLCSLGQLKNLRNLQLDLVFEDANVVWEDRKKSIVHSLCKLGTKNLRSLEIFGSLDIYGGSCLLQETLCLPTLEKLITFSSAVPQVPAWMSSLINLQQLRIEVEVVKQNDLCILGALPSLLVLHLGEEKRSNQKLRISGKVGFRFLKIFVYDACFKLGDLMFGAGSMPKLVKLVLNSLWVVEADSLDFGIKNLPSLSSVKLGGDYGAVKTVKTAMERAVSAHPNHPAIVT